MRNLLNPKWIFVINTLPIVVLLFLFIGQFNIIKSLLDEDNVRLWMFFGWTLGTLGLLNLIYGLYLIIQKKNISFIYGILALLIYIAFLYAFYSEEILPFTIPQWMVSGNFSLYPGTFLMPTLIYSLFILVVHFTPENKEHKAGMNFIISILVPVVWYLFSQLILPFWRPVDENFSIHALIIFVIAGTLIFLFFLIRGVFIVATKKADIWKKYQLAWKIPISLVLPIFGLAINNGHLLQGFRMGGSGVFGDFNNHWFYILTVINSSVICLPNLENKLYRICLFIGRCITFAYTFYFFIVFLPFLPISVIAIVAIGAGFLMLAPLILFVIHINELSKDFTFLKKHLSNKQLVSIAVLSFLIIPSSITFIYLKDKSVLNETLSYIYAPDYSKEYAIDKESLRKTLHVVKRHKDRRGDLLFSGQIPYLSSYFNWLVLDNLTLSEAKLSKIEELFFDTPRIVRSENIQNDKVHITNISTNSTFDKSQNAWISWVDMEITNNSDNTWFSEFATTIDVPAGCWISDYYLYVGDKKEEGILAEKKSAMWVFSQIRNSNRDPGILYYLTGNKVAFRVFPFAKNEVRRTGIQFIHKEPVKFNIEKNTVELGDSLEAAAYEKQNNPNVIYVSSKEKQLLKKVQRKPYYHFLIDVSESKRRNFSDFTTRIDSTLAANKELAQHAQFSFVNTYVNTCKRADDWKKKYEMCNFEGGFFMDRAVKTVLYNSYKTQGDSYPVIVVVTDNFEKVILEQDFSDFKMAFPESDLFFSLDRQARMHPHSLVSDPKQELPDSVLLSMKNNHVLKYELNGAIAYLPDNAQSEIILKNELFNIADSEIKEKNWQSALTMQGKWLSQVLHPETSDEEWLNLVKYSFISKVMSPVTSYLVVENEAQKAILKKKQEQVLSSNKSLDLDDDTPRMSEPGLIVLVILFGVYLFYVERRKRQLKQKGI